MSMTKPEMAKIIADNAGITQAAAKKAVDTIVGLLVDGVNTTGRFDLYGVGVFTLVERAARAGRNPQTGAPIAVAAKKSVKFRPAVSFKKAVNGE